MINLCDCCKALNAAPRRADVPRHLKRVSVVDEGPRLRGFHFECAACRTPWSWSVSQGWHAKWSDTMLVEGVSLRAPLPRLDQPVTPPDLARPA